MNMRNLKSLALAMLLGVVAMPLLGTSCSRTVGSADILVPEADTAKDQWWIAERQKAVANGVYDKNVREDELRKAIAAYRSVETRFPDDERYTPVASLMVATIQRELENYEAAIRQYEHVLKSYPTDEEVRVSALYGLGLSLDRANRQAEALVYYKQVLDEYSSSTKPRVRPIVDEVRQLYRQVRIIQR